MPPQSCQEIEEGAAGHEHCSCTPDKVKVCAAAQLGTAESTLGKGTLLEKEKPSASASPALGKARDLKQSDSDVSLNSLGLPKSCKFLLPSLGKGRARKLLLQSLGKGRARAARGSRLGKAICFCGHRARRPGSRVPQKEEHLMEMMGHSPSPKTLAKKRPAAALEKAAAKAPKAAAKAAAKRKTIAQNPKRPYLQGTTDGLEKLRLVVEVPERRTPDFEEIIDQIKAALEKDHLTKAEAIAMRERLYAKKGC